MVWYGTCCWCVRVHDLYCPQHCKKSADQYFLGSVCVPVPNLPVVGRKLSFRRSHQYVRIFCGTGTHFLLVYWFHLTVSFNLKFTTTKITFFVSKPVCSVQVPTVLLLLLFCATVLIILIRSKQSSNQYTIIYNQYLRTIVDKMVAVEYETPMKMALSVAKEATPNSSGKEIVSIWLRCIQFNLYAVA